MSSATAMEKAEQLADVAIERVKTLAFLANGFGEAERVVLRRALAEAFAPLLDPVQPLSPDQTKGGAGWPG